MVEALKADGIQDREVLEAMRVIPRHLFVPAGYRMRAYEADLSINIGEGQTISQPLVVARMTEAACITSSERVLEIGTGSGYQAAVLGKLARFVCTVERFPSLARTAQQRLDELGFENISVKVMDGTLGWRGQGPYGAIIVTAGAPEVPKMLLEQLADGGRLIIPVGDRRTQELRLIRRAGDVFESNLLGSARFVPLVGRFGWEEE